MYCFNGNQKFKINMNFYIFNNIRYSSVINYTRGTAFKYLKNVIKIHSLFQREK